MCRVYYSVQSHRKIVHLPHCGILKRIARQNLRSFESLEEAQAQGYRLCNCCPSIAQKYRKERRRVQNFCHLQGLELRLQNGALHVISRHDCWRILTNGHKNKLFLYHKNTDQRRNKGPHPSIVPGFHWQPFRSSSILGYLEFIVSHDLYRDEHPCTEKMLPQTGRKEMLAEKLPEWLLDKYGSDYLFADDQSYQRIKGTKKYKKEMARKKRQKRRAAIIRVNALLDELAVMGY